MPGIIVPARARDLNIGTRRSGKNLVQEYPRLLGAIRTAACACRRGHCEVLEAWPIRLEWRRQACTERTGWLGNDSLIAENRLIIISLGGMIKFLYKKPVSDTLIPTPNGALVVDTEKLMKKENVRRMMQDIPSKTRVAPPRIDKDKAVVPA